MIWARMLAYITGTVDQERNLPLIWALRIRFSASRNWIRC